MSDLNAQQELFLEYLFNDPECQNDTQLACTAAGYSLDYHATLVRNLQDEILRRANNELARKTPKAVSKLIQMMDEDGSIPKADIRLKAVESLLDRVGLAKKQEMSISMDTETPLFFIPAKVDPVSIDTEEDN